MRPLLKIGLLTLVILTSQIFSGKSAAQNGGYSGAYLRLGAGVRALGTGGAFVALANDATAGYWNPAGLGQLTEPQIGGMYSVLSFGRQYNYATAAYPLGYYGTIGVSWLNYRLGDIETRNQFGAVTGKISNDETALLFSYGNQVLEKLAVGGSAKLLLHNLAGSSASGFGFDVGAQFMPWDFLAVGVSVQNINAKVTWNTLRKTQETYPLNSRFGVNVKPFAFMNLLADYELVDRQKSGKLHAGMEILLSNSLGFRAGNDDGVITAGASLMRLNVGSSALEIDYGFANDHLEQNSAHRVSFLLKFGQSSEEIALLNRRKKKADERVEEQLAAETRSESRLTVEDDPEESLEAVAKTMPDETAPTIFEKIISDPDDGILPEEKAGLLVERPNSEAEMTSMAQRENAEGGVTISETFAAAEQNEPGETTMVTFEKEGLTVTKATTAAESSAITPKQTFGSNQGLTIPEIEPGKRVGHSLVALFSAQIIEARPHYWIINLGEREGFNTEMVVEIFEATPDDEAGRSLGTAQPYEIRNRYSIVKIIDAKSDNLPSIGKRVMLKYLYPAVSY